MLVLHNKKKGDKIYIGNFSLFQIHGIYLTLGKTSGQTQSPKMSNYSSNRKWMCSDQRIYQQFNFASFSFHQSFAFNSQDSVSFPEAGTHLSKLSPFFMKSSSFSLAYSTTSLWSSTPWFTPNGPWKKKKRRFLSKGQDTLLPTTYHGLLSKHALSGHVLNILTVCRNAKNQQLIISNNYFVTIVKTFQVIFIVEMLKVLWSLNFFCFFFCFTCKVNIFGFWTVGQTKQPISVGL